MNSIFWQIIVGIILIAMGALINLWVIRWARREKIPEDVVLLTAALDFQTGRIDGVLKHQGVNSSDMIEIRERLVRVETKINGSWKPPGETK